MVNGFCFTSSSHFWEIFTSSRLKVSILFICRQFIPLFGIDPIFFSAPTSSLILLENLFWWPIKTCLNPTLLKTYAFNQPPASWGLFLPYLLLVLFYSFLDPWWFGGADFFYLGASLFGLLPAGSSCFYKRLAYLIGLGHAANSSNLFFASVISQIVGFGFPWFIEDWLSVTISAIAAISVVIIFFSLLQPSQLYVHRPKEMNSVI